jgi:hypothetical protein
MQEELVRSHPPIIRYRHDLGNYLTTLGRAHWQTGSPSQAFDCYRRACSILESLPQLAPEDRYNIACSYAVQAALARKRGGDADPEALSDRAMESLLRAVQAGYRDLANLRTDANLDSLRFRSDFQLLMMDLALPDVPFAR